MAMTPALSYPRAVPGGGFEIDLRGLYFVIRERAWLIVFCTLLALGGGLGYLAVTPRTYVASATVEVESAAPNVMDVKAIEATTLDSMEAVKTIETKLNTSTLLRRLARDPELGVTAEKLGLPVASSSEAITNCLRDMLSVGLIRGTRLIGITAAHADPEFAAKLANGVVRNYVQQLSDERAGVTQQANSYLNNEVVRLKAKLGESERAIQAYRENTQTASLVENQNIIVAQLQELNAKLTEARTERLKLEAAVDQIRVWKEKAPEQLLSIAAVATAPGVVEQQKRFAEMKGELANLGERYLSEHPKLIQAKSQLEQGQKELERAIFHAAYGVEVALETATKTEANYAGAVADQEQKALALNKAAIGYKVLEREVESDRVMFEAVLKRLQETDVTRGLDQGVVRLVEPAVAPERPAKPRKKLILAAAGAVGLLIGGLVTLFLNALDPSLRTVDQTERALGMQVLAAVPKGRRRGGVRALVDADEGMLAEAFRTLRTSLALRDGGPRTILFTSATENDGKTFCAINCAAALARAGFRTLLVDADLRKPSIDGALFPGETKPGLAEVLQARVPLDQAVRETAVPNLSALTAGRAIFNPSELLNGRVFSDFIGAVSAQYDCVVVDSAPLQAVSDTLLLVKTVKTVCFVLRAGETHRRAAIKSCQSLMEAGAPPAGIILNRVPGNSRGYYYHYQAGKYGQDVYGEAQERAALLKGGEPERDALPGPASLRIPAHTSGTVRQSTSPPTAS
jgi:capsular exopolysaccharide synthesis family protein